MGLIPRGGQKISTLLKQRPLGIYRPLSPTIAPKKHFLTVDLTVKGSMAAGHGLVGFIALAAYGFFSEADSHHFAKDLVGAWRLVATEQRLTDGTRRPSPLYGKDGAGYLIYSASGRMCAVLGDPTRAKWKSEDSPSADELQVMFDHFVAYCGRYEVNETERYVIHEVEMDMVPNNVGSRLKRFFSLKGDTLILKTAEAGPDIVEYTLTWKRITR